MVLVVAISAPASAQFVPNNIGNSNGLQNAAVAAIAVAGGVTILVLYLVLRKPSITGCIQSSNGVTSLTDEKHHRTYALADAGMGLKPGERVKLKGKKSTAKDGTVTFRVKEIEQDYGVCTP